MRAPQICGGVGEHHDLLVMLHSWDFISFQRHHGAADRRLVKRKAIGGIIPAFQRHNATTLPPVITMKSESAFISLPEECSIDVLGYAIEQTVSYESLR